MVQMSNGWWSLLHSRHTQVILLLLTNQWVQIFIQISFVWDWLRTGMLLATCYKSHRNNIRNSHHTFPTINTVDWFCKYDKAYCEYNTGSVLKWFRWPLVKDYLHTIFTGVVTICPFGILLLLLAYKDDLQSGERM